MAAFLPIVVLLLAGSNEAASVTPVQKVIQLLTNMKAAAQQAKNEEAVEFSKFKQFCEDTQANKEKHIKDANQVIEDLSADVQKLDSDIKSLTTKIAELNDLIETSEANIKEANEQREKDKESYTAQIADFAESADALERAVAVLKKQNFNRKQAAEALLQLSTSLNVPASAQRALTAFVEMSTDPEARDEFIYRDAPEAAAYEFQSGGILDLLEKLRVEFTEKRTDAEKEEMNSKHAHGMVVQDLTDTIEGAKSDIADKTMDLNEKRKLVATKKKELATTTADRDEDVKYLASLKAECSEKSKSFEEKQALRVEEMQAVDKAIEILASSAVSGAADEHLPAAFVQKKSASALAQVRSGGDPAAVRRQLVAFLKSAGQRLGSHRIAVLAEKVSVSSDPFKKVKGLIEALIHNLLAEINEETEQKGWCDKELGTNKIQRTKLQDTIEELTAKIDEGKAFLTKSTQQVATLSEEVAELTTSMAEATTLRLEEQKKNAATVKDAIDAQQAVASARKVLEVFYAKASGATAFVQVSQEPVKMDSEEWNALGNPNFVTGGGTQKVDKGHKEGMQTFGETYKGQQDDAGGVLAMLEVISSDFARLQTETEMAESEAVAAYEDFMASSKKAVAVKTKESEMLNNDIQSAEADLARDKKDLAESQDQLLAADRYYDKLKPSCVDTGLSYEKRSKARQEEIESLQEALTILQGGDFA